MLKGYYLLENALLSVGGADKFSYSEEGSSGFAGANREVFRRQETAFGGGCFILDSCFRGNDKGLSHSAKVLRKM